jgi:hypothetical protein
LAARRPKIVELGRHQSVELAQEKAHPPRDAADRRTQLVFVIVLPVIRVAAGLGRTTRSGRVAAATDRDLVHRSGGTRIRHGRRTDSMVFTGWFSGGCCHRG